MMSKARKILIEKGEITEIYERTISRCEDNEYWVTTYQEKINEILEEDPSADTSYYTKEIEEYSIKISTDKKIMECLLKLM